MKGSTFLFFLGICLLPVPSVWASYNSLPRADAASLGMADANVALAGGPSSQFINPANLVAEPSTGWRWEAGSLLGRVQMDLTRTQHSSSANTEYPVIPFLAVSRRHSDNFFWGFGIDVPFGIGLKWPDGAFEANLGPLLGLKDIAGEAEITVVRAGPALAWRAHENLSFGARVFYQEIEALDVNEIGGAEGDGNSVGAQIGASYRTSRWMFGAAYTFRSHTEIRGDTSLIGTSMQGKADIHVPARLQAGIALELRPDLWWEIDLDWLGWSYIDELTIVRANGEILNAGRNARHFDDALSVRTGVCWRVRSDRIVYAGLGYDPSPVDERDASPTINNLAMTRLGLGAGFLLKSGLRLDVAYQYVRGQPRRITETDQDNIAGIDTELFEGTYRTKSHVLGLTLGALF